MIDLGQIPWTADDDRRAESEGWGLFDNTSNGRTELQRIDEMGYWIDDDQVWAWVLLCAREGRMLARHVLSWLAVNSPDEYALIVASETTE